MTLGQGTVNCMLGSLIMSQDLDLLKTCQMAWWAWLHLLAESHALLSYAIYDKLNTCGGDHESTCYSLSRSLSEGSG